MSSATGKRAASVSVGSNSLGSKGGNGKGHSVGPANRLASLPVAAVSHGARAGDAARVTTALPACVVPARPGEHVLARQMLAGVMRGPSSAEFQAQLDDPFYEPTDRLFCKVNDVVVGHARLVRREMHFASAILPVTLLVDLLVLPEFRGRGCGAALLAEAEREMIADGSPLAILRTQHPRFFLQRGWSVWTRHSYSVAGAREILSCLLQSAREIPETLGNHTPRYNIRLWRHIELTCLRKLYEQNTACSFGALVRTEAYWHWLLSRHAFDRIYVALNGPDRWELEELPPIVGYAVMKEGRILELMTSPDHPEAADQLLARACSDAIEQDSHYVRLDAPVGDPLHHVIARAGGELGYHESLHGEVCLVKVLDIPRTCELLGDVLLQRARQGNLPLPLELGLHIDQAKYTLELRARSVRLRPGRSCRSYLECTRADFTQLLLGHLDLRVALASGRLQPSTRVAAELAAVLFPKLPLWRPPWDEFPAN